MRSRSAGMFRRMTGRRGSRGPRASRPVCLSSFVYCAFPVTGTLNAFDGPIFCLDFCASLLLPPLFLHFCLEFALRNKWIERRHRLLRLIYLPAAVIFIIQLAFINGILG